MRVTQYSRGIGDPSRSRSVLGPRFRGDDNRICLARRRVTSPPQPFRLPRQVDGLDLFQLDGGFLHQGVDVAVRRSGYFRAIEIDLERAAMVLFGPGRWHADAVHAGRDPIL